eukprot:5555056-Prorocentrum_lima.AAC.1
MTVLFDKVHAARDPDTDLFLPRTCFSEVLFADDTICCSGDATALEELLHLIQLIGQLFGVLLNKTKCELLRLGTANESICFIDGDEVPMVVEAKYLGCYLNDHTDPRRELRHR